MNIKRYAILLFVFLQSMFLLAQEKSYVLLNYDKAYIVDISVDTTMRLNQLPQYKNKKSARFVKPHKVHCDFKLLYLWKNNYVVRAMVKNFERLQINNINAKYNYFDANIFCNEDTSYSCSYQDCYVKGESGFPLPNFYFSSNYGQYLIDINNSYFALDFSNVDILRCTPQKNNSSNQTIYYSSNIDCVITDKIVYAKKTDINALRNFIYQSLFCRKKDILIPESLPSQYNLYEKFNYNKSCCNGSNIIVKSVSKEVDKAVYQIEDNLIMYHIYKSNDDKYLYKQQLLYIPHVLYLPYCINHKQVSTLKNGYSIFTDYYFKYKINSINGIPLKEFMATYVDDFKPTFKQRNKS